MCVCMCVCVQKEAVMLSPVNNNFYVKMMILNITVRSLTFVQKVKINWAFIHTMVINLL